MAATAIEVWGVVDLKSDEPGDETECAQVDPASDTEPEFYSVYLHEDGNCMLEEDYPTRLEAVVAAHELSLKRGLPVEDMTGPRRTITVTVQARQTSPEEPFTEYDLLVAVQAACLEVHPVDGGTPVVPVIRAA